jgi:GNAT superfamily N-acetyltransferase
VRVRRAEPGDVDALVDLCAGLFAEDAGRHDPTIDQGWPRREGRGYFMQVIADDRSLGIVAEVAGMAVGYLVGRTREPVDTRPIRVAVLEAMYVGPPHRRQGAGAALVERFRAWARECRADRLSVTAYAANTGAIRFYDREGFAPRSLSLEAPARRT